MNTSPSRLSLASRAVVCGLLVLLLLSYATLSHKLGTSRQGSDIGFRIAFGLAFLGMLLLCARVDRFWHPIAAAARGTPVWFLLLLLNALVLTVLTINVFAKWGALLLLGVWGAMLLVGGLLPRESLSGFVREFVPKSLISFVAIYFFLIVLEVFLWFNPLLVGGGGGGNPALPRLYAGLAKSNSYGLRGKEFSLRPEAGTFRILMLGDSFTFGQGVAGDETYPHSVQSQLDARKTPTIFEVINAGVSASNTTGQLRRLREQGLKLEPDLITVQFYLNDLQAEPEDFSGLETFLEDLLFFPKRRSYSVFFLQYRFERLRDRVSRASDAPRNFVEDIAARLDRGGAGWIAFEAAVDGLAETSRDHDIPLVMILYPRPGKSSRANRQIHAAVGERIEMADLSVIDLIDAFEGLSPEEQAVSAIDTHPSPAAHRLAAARIVERLLELNLLPDS